jgi:stage V sporulation protein G
MDSDKGLFVAMPSRTYEDRNGETKYADIAHPISAEVRTAINDSVLKAYENALAEEQTQSGEDEVPDYDDIDEDDLPFEQSM